MKSVVTDTRLYDWEGDARSTGPGARPSSTRRTSRDDGRSGSGVPAELRGTYAGLIEKIPYLVDLGVTAIELLPVFQFDALAAPAGRTNYWGYQPISFFAPHAAYSSQAGRSPRSTTSATWSRRSIGRLEVILDVVYNHTAEGGADGPTSCFRGLANDDYYLLDPDDRRPTRTSAGQVTRSRATARSSAD
jgi:glycogen operon protein